MRSIKHPVDLCLSAIHHSLTYATVYMLPLNSQSSDKIPTEYDGARIGNRREYGDTEEDRLLLAGLRRATVGDTARPTNTGRATGRVVTGCFLQHWFHYLSVPTTCVTLLDIIEPCFLPILAVAR